MRFPIAGVLLCLWFSATHRMRILGKIDLVGTAVRKGVISSTPSQPGYFWAGRSLSFKEACAHFLVVGSTGSGKSITLNLLMQSVLTKHGDTTAKGAAIKRRAVVYDSKADLVSVIGGLVGDMGKIRILNPLDKRVTPWDFSADIITETDAVEFAAMLIPKAEMDSSPYFANTARSLVAGVIKRFQFEARKKAIRLPSGKLQIPPRAWTLRDVIQAFESRGRLELILDHPETRYLMDHFSKDNAKTFAGVKSTADTALEVYRTAAALLAAANNPPISLNDWVLNQESVLVLGNHEKSREATDTLNRLVMQHLSKALISREVVGDPEADQTWIFLDELREAGVLSGLRQLLLRGRSKGVAVAMGFQDVEGIFAAYGDHEGAEIIGAAQSLVTLHVNASAPKTAQWNSDAYSSRREEVPSLGFQSGEKGSSSSEQMSPQQVPNVFPIQFVELDLPTPASGLEFFSYTMKDGYRYFEYSWKGGFLEQEGYFQKADARRFPDFQLNEDYDAYRLKPWDNDDVKRLGLDEQVLAVMHSQKIGAQGPQVSFGQLLGLEEPRSAEFEPQ